MIRRVRAGEKLRIPARDWNTIADAVNALSAGSLDLSRGDVAGVRMDRQSSILVRNDCGADVVRFGALLAGPPIIAPSVNEAEFVDRASLTGVLPTGAAGTACILIPQVPLKDGAIGRCVLSGLTVARVAVSSSSHAYADLASGSTTLISAATGPCRIVWKSAGTGTKLCLVLVNQSAAPAATERLRFKVGAATPISGATATVGGTSQAVRWTYPLTQVRWNPTTKANDTVSGGVTPSAATNQNEDGNNTTVLGPGHLISEIPTGWKYLPVGKAGATSVSIDVYVEGWQEWDPGTSTWNWRFCHPNQLGGAC